MTELKNISACVRLTLSGAFSVVWSMKVYPLEKRCSYTWFPGDCNFWKDGTWRILRTIQFNQKSLTYRTLHALSHFAHENNFFRSTPSKFFEKQFSFVKSYTKLLSFHCRPSNSEVNMLGPEVRDFPGMDIRLIIHFIIWPFKHWKKKSGGVFQYPLVSERDHVHWTKTNLAIGTSSDRRNSFFENETIFVFITQRSRAKI